MMICMGCRCGHHSKCDNGTIKKDSVEVILKGTWCDCQHRINSAKPLPKPNTGMLDSSHARKTGDEQWSAETTKQTVTTPPSTSPYGSDLPPLVALVHSVASYLEEQTNTPDTEHAST